MTTWAYVLAAIALAVVAALLASLLTKSKMIGKIDFMSDAIVSGDTAFRYSESLWKNRRLNRALNRLRGIFEQEKNELRERDLYFRAMLDHVQSGVLVLDAEDIPYCNAAAKELLGLPDIVSLKQIERLSPTLAAALASAVENETRSSLDSVQGSRQIAISACSASIHGKSVKIVTFNDITREMENNESESWTRLIRVLTHEIMNTVTPVASLSAELSQHFSDYDTDDVRKALSTIASSSESLISFVQSYRSLTRIAVSQRRAIYLRDIANDAVNMARAAWPGVNIIYEEKSDDIIIYVDQGQVSQVMNNLLKNAAQAGAHNIRISAEIDKRDRTVVQVSNDGEPIGKEAQEQLFVPFYTTKGSEGSGIGLSLSRQMLRLNGGSITLTASGPGLTVFTIVF